MGDRGGRKERLGGCCRVAMGVGGGGEKIWLESESGVSDYEGGTSRS